MESSHDKPPGYHLFPEDKEPQLSDKEKIGNLIHTLQSVAAWLTSDILPIYKPYHKAIYNPIRVGEIAEEKKLMTESFPKYTSPFDVNPNPLGILLKDKFNTFCERNNVGTDLDECARELSNLIEKKGTGEIGAYKMYDTVTKLWSALEKFQESLKIGGRRRMKRE